VLNERLRLPGPIPISHEVIGLKFWTMIAGREAEITFDDPAVEPEPDKALVIREVGLSWDGDWQDIVDLLEWDDEAEHEPDDDDYLRQFDGHVRDWFRLVTNWLAALPRPHRAMPKDLPNRPLLLLGDRQEGSFGFITFYDGLVFNPNGIFVAVTRAGHGDQLPIPHLLLVEAVTSLKDFERRLPVLSAAAALENAYRSQLTPEENESVRYLLRLDDKVRGVDTALPLDRGRVQQLNDCRNNVAHEGYNPSQEETGDCVKIAEELVNYLCPLRAEAD
jgi:hypothetical protein